jgi:hypothetical protein
MIMIIKYRHLFDAMKYKFHPIGLALRNLITSGKISASRFWRQKAGQRVILGLFIFSVLFFALIIPSKFFYPTLAKKPAPALQIVIQKPEPTRIEKIERPPSAAERAEEKYQEAIERLHQGGAREELNPTRISEAVFTLRHILAQFPIYPPAREALATLLIKQGNLQEANRIVTIGLLQDPRYLPYLKLRLYILIKQGNMNKAMVLIKNTPELGEYMQRRG